MAEDDKTYIAIWDGHDRLGRVQKVEVFPNYWSLKEFLDDSKYDPETLVIYQGELFLR